MKIEDTDNFFKFALSKTGDAIYLINSNGKFRYVNDTACRMLGYTRDELLSMGVPDISPLYPLEKFKKIWSAIRENKVLTLETVHRRKDGTEFPVEITTNYFEYEGKDYTCSIVRDISERKAVMERLRDSQEKLENLMEAVPTGIVISTPDGRLLEANSAALKIVGYDKKEEFLSQKAALHYFDPQDRIRLIDFMIKDGRVVDFEVKAKRQDGTIFWASMNSIKQTAPDGNILFINVFQDITLRKEAEEALKRSEARLSEAQRVARIGSWDWDIENNKLYWSDEIYRIFGLRPQESGADYEAFLDIVHPDDRNIVKKSVDEALCEMKQYSIDHRIVVPDGIERVVHEQAEVTFDGSGRPVRMFGTVQDITEVKMAEMALKESLDNFKRIFNSTFNGIAIHDNGIILDLNEAHARMLGYERSELIGTCILDYVPDEESRNRIINNIGAGYEGPYEIKGIRKDGTEIIVEVSGQPFTYKGRIVRLTELRDTTEEKRLKIELNKMQKLESLGILAGGIAHDFNNLLTAILGNISLAKVSLNSEDDIFKRLTEAEKASFSAQDLTYQLLTFARGGAPLLKSVSIEEIIEDSCSFALRGSNVTCEHYFSDGLYPINADKGQISQVIHNLVLNAVQAMPKGGRIKIRAENTTLSSGEIPPLKGGNYVRISIEDNGTGIPEEHLQNIFDPYFTTKEMGSGLGLSIVYSIVKNHNGYMDVKSEVGAGSTFNIYLQSSDIKPEPEEKTDEAPVVSGGKILIMDDNEMVRNFTADALDYLGYDVVFAEEGSKAIELYKKAAGAGKKFDAVIMDLTIQGGMGGREAINELLKVDSSAKVIVTSGYSKDPIMSDYKNHGFKDVLAKPYKPSELSQVINRVINRSDG